MELLTQTGRNGEATQWLQWLVQKGYARPA